MLPRTLFRQLSRNARHLEALATARDLPLAKELEKFDSLEYTESLLPTETLASYVRREFNTFTTWTDTEDVKMCTDLAFKALRQSHQRIAQLKDEHWLCRNALIHFKVGQVVRHKKYGYRGVITGWDSKCMAPLNWQRKNRIQTLADAENQPFYNLLVDQRDDQIRSQTYCAQENLMDATEAETDNDTKECLKNELIDDYFESYSFRHARYRPNDELRTLYPED
jgi:hemimethylated DNA binding protein